MDYKYLYGKQSTLVHMWYIFELFSTNLFAVKMLISLNNQSHTYLLPSYFLNESAFM